MWRRVARWTGITIAVLFVAIQLVPYGREHANPPVVREPPWNSARTRALAARACFDCHSHETTWPWYAFVAPVSWLIQWDVDEGRKEVNYSAWGPAQAEEAAKSADTVREGTMPPWFYTILNPSARLSPDERQALIRGLEATFVRAEADGDEDREAAAAGRRQR